MNPIRSIEDILTPNIYRKRFLQSIDIRTAEECWNWNWSLNQGRGMLTVQHNLLRTSHKVYSSRLSWIFFRGPIPEYLCVLHTCDNPRCCNPNHLYLGTKKNNAQDREDRGRGGTSRDEVKDKIRKSLTGRKASEKTKERMRESSRKRWENQT